MTITPGSLQLNSEVQASTIGDQAPTPIAGSVEIFANQNGNFYSKNSAGVVTLLTGAVDSTVVHNTGNETIAGTKTFSSKPVLSTGEKFTGIASPAYDQGALVYDTDNESLTFFNNDSNLSLQIGQEEWIRVKNTTGSTIANGSAVYINGTSASLPTVALAKGDASTTIIAAGLTTESIANNAIGYVTTMGVVHGIDTSSFTAGATVFVSATTAGLLTATAPIAPNFRYRIGIVIVADPTVGSIHVTPSTAALGNGTANQVFGINNAGTAQEVKTIQGTASDVIVTNGTNTITVATTGKAVSSRLINTTAPLTGGGDLSADRTLALSAATTSTAGSMSAIDKVTVNNLWYDVTNYGVSTGNTGTANVTALNTLIQTTAPSGARFFFPSTGANYPLTGTVTVTQNYQSFIGTGMRSSVIFSANTTVDLFVLTDGVRNITFQDLGFWSTGTASAGTMIRCGTPSGSGNAQVNIYRCGAEGFGGNWYDLILYNGTLAGLLCNIEDCNFNAFIHYGVGVIGNTTIPSTVSANVIANTTFNGNINGTTGATAGIFVRQCGALQITNSDIIQCTNNLLIQPAASGEIIASIYADNSYFDSSYGSCVKIAGSGPVVRLKFTSCSFTVAGGANNYSAFESNSTATNAPAGIDILNCSIQNTFSNSGTSNGLLLTTIADTKIEGNNISGFTNGINATPFAGQVTRLNLIGNTIGPAGGIKGNTTGILLNAGATPYGMIQVVDNVFPATTPYGAANGTNITDNSVAGTGTAAINQKSILNNNGTIISAPTANYAATAFPLTTVTNLDSRGGVFIPAGSRPSSGTITAYLTNAATIQTFGPVTIKYGTTNSNADATLLTSSVFVAGTLLVGSAMIVVDWDIISSTTIQVSYKFYNTNNAATGISTKLTEYLALSAPATISTAANNWLGVYAADTVAGIVTVRSVKYEVQSQ